MWLERYEVLRTKQLDHAREAIGRIFVPHRLDLFGRDSTLDARMCSHRLLDISVNYVTYGGNVRIEPGPLGTFYVVQIPLSGHAEIHYGNARVSSRPGLATVVSPMDSFEMRWSDDCAQLICRIEQSALEARLTDLIDAPLGERLRFKPEMDVTSGGGQSWSHTLRMLAAEIDRVGASIEHPLVAENVERTMMTALLVGQPHNYTRMLESEGARPPAAPRVVRVAVDWIENSPQYAHSTASLAREAGVTERALQNGFRKHLQLTPMEYLREVRLRRVRDELRAAQPGAATITKIAGRWGFFHMGHFGTRYFERFGEKPSETLRC